VLSIVTGGAGFICSHIVDSLLDMGHDVIVIDNMSTGRRENLAHVEGRVRIIENNIAEPGEWQRAFQGADWVFHMAALAALVPSLLRRTESFRANVDGTFNVLEGARAAGVKRLIYAASSWCYGIPDVYPISLKTPQNHRSTPTPRPR